MLFMTSAPNHLRRLSGNKVGLLLLLTLLLALAACNGDDGSDNQPEVAVNPTATETEVPTATATPAQIQLRVIVSRASVFSLPNRTAEVIYSLVEGDELPVSGKSEPDELGTIFYLVRIGDRTGWVAASQVEFSGDESQLAIVSAPNLDILTDAPTLLPPGQVVAVVIVSESSVLDYPGPEGNAFTTAEELAEFEVIGKTPVQEDGTIFYGVRVEDRLGWLRSNDVQILGDTNALQVVVTSTPTATAVIDASTTPLPEISPTRLAQETTLPSATVAQGTPTITPFQAATSTSTPIALTPTASPTILPIQPAIRLAEPPLLTVDLPESWDEGHFLIPISSPYSSDDIVLSKYEGPLPEGMIGNIWLLSQFPNVVPVGGDLDLWPDAILYLRALLFEGCNIGLNLEGRRTYVIDGQEALGTTFSAVDCGEDVPDVAGWFMALQYRGENYIFYVAIEPATRYTAGAPYMQSVVGSVRFIAGE